jgi:ABC-type Mn2+/Zn2+ transport system permease subunit
MKLSKTTGTSLSLISVLLALAFYFAFPGRFSAIWLAVLISASASFAIISSMMAARNLYFLGGAIPHSALLSASISMLASLTIGGNAFLWSLPFNVFMILAVGYAIHRGVDANKAISVFVGITASLTVTVLYYLTTHFYVARSVTSDILGDPLLATTSDAYLALSVLALTLVVYVFTYKENTMIGLLGNDAWLSGVNVYFYDFIFYILIAVVSTSYMKIVGFILTHIFILIPGAVASISSWSTTEAIRVAVGISMLSSSLGLILGVFLNLSPAGLSGVIMVLIYGFLSFVRRR